MRQRGVSGALGQAVASTAQQQATDAAALADAVECLAAAVTASEQGLLIGFESGALPACADALQVSPCSA